jgi:hypothetical protein
MLIFFINMEHVLLVELPILLQLVTGELLRLPDGSGCYMWSEQFHFSSTSCHWTQVHVTNRLYTSLGMDLKLKIKRELIMINNY